MVFARRSSRRLASLGVDGTPTRVIAGAVRRLLLQGREERLRDGVVEGRAALGHREVDAGLAAALTEGQRDVLRAAIGRWTRPAAGRRHLAGSRPRLITSAAPRRFLVHSSGSGVAGRRAARETAPRHGRRSRTPTYLCPRSTVRRCVWLDGAIFDITERRRAEDAVREHETERARLEEVRASRAHRRGRRRRPLRATATGPRARGAPRRPTRAGTEGVATDVCSLTASGGRPEPRRRDRRGCLGR